MRRLIVNADDFGQSPGVNQGVIRAHERGIVTSASLMVRWPAAVDAASYARGRPALSVGLHLDLEEWAFRHGAWTRLYGVVPVDDLTTVTAEVERQLAAFRVLLGHDPTHFDSHQNVHLREPVRTVLAGVAAASRRPLRLCSEQPAYCGAFYGQTADGAPQADRISVASLIEILGDLPAGVTELSCHPAVGCDLDTMYLHEREEETRVLCDPRVQHAIRTLGVELCSFSDLGTLSARG
jgi:chitin disaccharide deacetylase